MGEAMEQCLWARGPRPCQPRRQRPSVLPPVVLRPPEPDPEVLAARNARRKALLENHLVMKRKQIPGATEEWELLHAPAPSRMSPEVAYGKAAALLLPPVNVAIPSRAKRSAADARRAGAAMDMAAGSADAAASEQQTEVAEVRASEDTLSELPSVAQPHMPPHLNDPMASPQEAPSSVPSAAASPREPDVAALLRAKSEGQFGHLLRSTAVAYAPALDTIAAANRRRIPKTTSLPQINSKSRRQPDPPPQRWRPLC